MEYRGRGEHKVGWVQPIFFCITRCVWVDFEWLDADDTELNETELDEADRLTNLGELLEKTVPALGYELVGWEFAANRLLRVYIDVPKGIDVEDCARVSHQLTHLFTVENVDFARLEVSSPGLDRPLTKAADFARFVGEEAKFTLREPIEKAKKFKGILRGVEGEAALVETARGVQSIPFDLIERARLVPRIEWRRT